MNCCETQAVQAWCDGSNWSSAGPGGEVSEQKLATANVGTSPNYCLVLFSCSLLSGNSFSEDKADVSNTGLPTVWEGVGCGMQVRIQSLVQNWLKSPCDTGKCNAGSVTCSTAFISEVNRNPLPGAENSHLLNIWGRICGAKT